MTEGAGTDTGIPGLTPSGSGLLATESATMPRPSRASDLEPGGLLAEAGCSAACRALLAGEQV